MHPKKQTALLLAGIEELCVVYDEFLFRINRKGAKLRKKQFRDGASEGEQVGVGRIFQQKNICDLKL